MQTFTRKPKANLPASIFSGAPLHSLSASQPGDRWEQEAQRMADRALAATGPQGIPGPSTGDETSGGSGQPLDPATRSFMEPRFNFDFGHIRLHADTQAAQATEAVNARAFTFGNNIVFGAGQYAPRSAATRSLLAHELAHVVQQGTAPQGNIPTILRQSNSSGASGQTAAPANPQALLRQQYIQLICEVIADIRRAVEEGRTWTFENEFRLQGEEWLGDPATSLVHERWEMLQEVVRNLDEIIGLLESGTIQPTTPPTRMEVARLWGARNFRQMTDQTPRSPIRWSDPARYSHPRGRPPVALYHSQAAYIHMEPTSPPGMLHSASFPTWWVFGCHSAARPETPRTPQPGPVTPESLGLSGPDIFAYRDANGMLTSWDEERGGAAYIASRPFGPHQWHYDESAGRVYITVDGVQYNLFDYGRLERQR